MYIPEEIYCLVVYFLRENMQEKILLYRTINLHQNVVGTDHR